jgi:3-phosphoshikimate 1-carboxyvinyltransferase
MIYQVSRNDRQLENDITLDGSKSISNRALIIRALCRDDFEISFLSSSRDTQTLQKLLVSDESVLDAGAAGTTFRFMTAYLALKDGTQVLTGSQRMKMRPIGVLVDALRQIGASIEYLEKEGYPPLKIGSPQIGETNHLIIPANISSQYISALLMIAPSLPSGLLLQLSKKIVSRPYIEMTLNLMAFFGIEYKWKNDFINISPQNYIAKDYKVEADWSAASYYFSMAAFSESLDLQLNNLWKNSVQGDAVVVDIMKQFGISTTFNEKGVRLKKSGEPIPKSFEWDFIKCPDIAQTLAVISAGLGTKGLFTGLETLRIKETDRISALHDELEKVGVSFSKVPTPLSGEYGKEYFQVQGKAQVDQPLFKTYEDHRMAMAFAPLAMYGKVLIEDPLVVEKSYPNFWNDLAKLGFQIEEKINAL